MAFKVYTLGCRLNKAESKSIEEQLQKINFNREIIIVNTCSATAKADKESRQLLRKLRRENPEAFLVATGCWAENQLKIQNEKFKTSVFGADLMVGNKEKGKIGKAIVKQLQSDGKAMVKHSKAIVKRLRGDSKAMVKQWESDRGLRRFVKIQDGCDKFCSYCIVPYLRGRSKSVSADKIVTQVEKLVKKGAREVILTGVDIGQYKIKNEKLKMKNLKAKGNDGLVGLLKKLLKETKIERIRVGSVSPEAITFELLALYSKNQPRLCRHFHISIQSGCNKTLKRMNRNYTVEQFAKKVKKARKKIPGVNITTDVIVGFPGESRQDFEESFQNIEKIGFGRLHVFRYSKRPGTLADKMAAKWGRVLEKEKAARSQKMRALGKQMQKEFEIQFAGQELDVLFEGKNKKGFWEGWSNNYIRARIKI